MIPVSSPEIGEAEKSMVLAALSEGEISSAGRFVREFEARWAAYCGRGHAVAVANGTVALQLAVACLDLEPGDEIIMPTFTIISCAMAAVYSGAVPRLVDADPRTWCMDVGAIAAAVGPRTRAIMPVHIYGHPVNMEPVLALAQRHGLAVIEDAAEAHGAQYRSPGSGTWRRCGSFGHISTFSFYANKLVTTGEGGMLLTDDATIAERARLLRNLAFEEGRRFCHDRLGFNFRMTNIQAALGIPQIARMEAIIEKKRWIAGEYSSLLRGIPGIQLPVEESWARSVYWMYGVVLDDKPGADAALIERRLAEDGVQTRPFFLGLHEQPVFRRRGWFVDASFPVAEGLARRGFYLPSGLGLGRDEIATVAEALDRAVA